MSSTSGLIDASTGPQFETWLRTFLKRSVSARSRNSRTVRDALTNGQWSIDVQGSLSTSATRQYLRIWDIMQQIQLDPSREDRFIWRWSPNQKYSASTAYRAFFTGQSGIPGPRNSSKPGRHRVVSSSSSGSLCWADAGPQSDCSAITFRIMALALSVPNALRQSVICCWAAASVGRFGFICYGRLRSNSLSQM
ncbi:hypothetical protein PR202_gb14285 [Eleusine coracana subsp. coracana]|uniref:Uncharacterized protein n=1 Tax=Eleusine coracana subsp. coracana TaxID=191504 RepID=A0AAV5EV30_ELECO|nr:hypothetical protein PR202_gb14285 [Eleusine coracana subsp. coracana]